MFKKTKVLFFVAILVITFAGTVSAYDSVVNTITFHDDNLTTKYSTLATTVEKFLKNEGIDILEKDKLSHSLDDKIYNGMDLKIFRGFYVRINFGDVVEKLKVEHGTKVGNLIAILDNGKGVEHIYENGLYSDDLVPNQMVHLKLKNVSTKISQEEIGFETNIVYDDELDEGIELVIVDGANGQKEITTQITFVDYKEYDRKIISEKINIDPINRVIKIGTKKPEPIKIVEEEPQVKEVFSNNSISTLDFKYSSKLTMTATAYTAGFESTGKRPGDKYYGITASGIKAKRGVVAVDPKVIPMGTKLYISGYGYAVAGDTGGAIKGKKIDLFMETVSECLKFGRRQVDVYILD